MTADKKKVASEVKSIEFKELDDTGVGLAKIATLNVVDSDGDLTLPGAFGEQEVSVLPAHNWGVHAIGKAQVFEIGDEVLAKFRLNLNTQAGRDWHQTMLFDLKEGKPVQQWSYGFVIKETSFREMPDVGQVRVLEKVLVYEISPVLVGAGEGTGTLAMKTSKPLPFAEQVDSVLAEIAVIIDRAEKIGDLRQKEGRGLSAGRLEQLADLQYKLGQVAVLYKGGAEVSTKDIIEAGHNLAEFQRVIGGIKKP